MQKDNQTDLPDLIPRALFENERQARLTTEALLEARSRELSEVKRKLVADAEAVRSALAETETARAREYSALKEKLILSEALATLSGKDSADGAMTALLSALMRDFECDQAFYVKTEADGTRVLLSASGDLIGATLPFGTEFVARARRFASVSAFSTPQAKTLAALTGLRSNLLVPVGPSDDGMGALWLASKAAGQFSSGDLRLLERVAQFALQTLTALREARRNALLVALIEGRVPETTEHVIDAPLEAVNRAFARLTDMQGNVVNILDALLTAPLADVDAAIETALARMGEVTGTDRVYVFRLRRERDFMDNTHEWVAPGIEPAKEMLQGVPTDLASVWEADFNAGREVFIPDVSKMLPDAPEREALEMQGIQSLLAVPLIIDGVYEGFVGYDSVRKLRNFLPGEIYLIRSVSKVIASMLARRDTEAALFVAHGDVLAQRARLESILAAMPDLILELDRDGRFVEWHSGTVKVSPQTDAWFRGRLLEDTLPPDLAALGRGLITALESGQDAPSIEFPFAIDARDAWWQLSAVRLGTQGFLFVMRDVTEARAKSAEIRRLSEIVRHTSNLVVVTNPQQRIEWVNEAFERATGFTLAEIKGSSPEVYLRSDLVDAKTIARLKTCFDTGGSIEVELPARARDGREFWIALDIQTLRGADGAIEGYMAVQTDVTERRAQAEALRQAAEIAAQARSTLEAAIEALQDGFALFDKDDHLVIFNQRFREFLPVTSEAIHPGATFEQILRSSLSKGMIVDAIGDEETWLKQRLDRHFAAYSETEVALADGRWIRILEKATGDGGHVGLWTDITALKLAEKRALADRATAMEASRDGMAISDADGNFLYMNAAHRKLFGFQSEAEGIGKHWTLLYTPENAAWMTEHAVSALKESGSWRGEVPGRRVDGTPLDLEISMTSQDDGSVFGIVRDISERRRNLAERERLQQELQLAQRREVIGQMAAGLAHDFNNLLATIAGSATLIELATEPGTPARAGADRIQAAADQAASLVKRLFTLGGRPVERQTIDLRKPVAEAADLVRASLRAPLYLSLSIPAEPVCALADPTDVLQVLLNLAINARDAIESGPGEISIRLEKTAEIDPGERMMIGTCNPDRQYLCLSVRDTGRGISGDLLEKIFRPYFTTKGDKGTGLGLAVVGSVILSNEGCLRVRSEVGKGTSFDVFWPLEPTAPAAASAPPVRPADLSGNLQGRTVLVVDDQQDVLDVITALLETAGAEVAPSTDARDVLDAVREDPGAWDLLITDYDMPSLTGAELATAVRDHAPDLPILLVTALPGLAGRSGVAFDQVLGKPINPEALIEAAERAIGQRPKG